MVKLRSESTEQPTFQNQHLEDNKRTNCVSYFPVDIHFLWHMTFDFDVFRVLVRSWEKKRIWI